MGNKKERLLMIIMGEIKVTQEHFRTDNSEPILLAALALELDTSKSEVFRYGLSVLSEKYFGTADPQKVSKIILNRK